MVSEDTEQDLVLTPRSHRQLFLRPKLENLLSKKFPRGRQVESDDTAISVSVNERGQRNLTRQFDNTDIDWSAIEKQLLTWAKLCRRGKRLRISISLNYVETAPPLSTSARRADKRGASSATQRMLTERDALIDAEEDASGQPSVWRE